MKVLHLVSGKLTSGANRGALWLHRGLIDLNVDSYLLTNDTIESPEENVGSLSKSIPQKLKYKILPLLGKIPLRFYPKREPWIFNTGFEGANFITHEAYKDADIVHLHWINGMVSTRMLNKIKKPIVWTLRDMWPMTGGCHYSMGCRRYELGCGHCPQLNSSRDFDLSRIIAANKLSSFPKSIRVVGISSWLSDCASKSKIFHDHQVQTISNNIDTDSFYPVDRSTARKSLGLSTREKIILIGAKSVSDYYKGFDLFVESLKYLNQSHFRVVIFGKSSQKELDVIPSEVTTLGHITDDNTMRLAYSAADVFVGPSRMDAFGKTLAESLSCGTPVVCFDATGPADIVDHKLTGFKAKPFEAEDLAHGIKWVLTRNKNQTILLKHAARERAIKLFDSRVIARQYLSLYNELIAQRKG